MGERGQPAREPTRPRPRWRRLLASIFDGNFPLGVIQEVGEWVDEGRERPRAGETADVGAEEAGDDDRR